MEDKKRNDPEPPFVWRKKLKKEGLSDVAPEHLEAITARRVEENKVKDFLFFYLNKNICFRLN
jgi:hypothetical protein